MSEYLLAEVPTVIKIGGSIGAQRSGTLNDIAFLHQQLGFPLVVVHGGGPEIDAALKEKNIEPQKIDGQRVTDSKTLSVVVSVLNGINQQIVTVLQEQGDLVSPYIFDSGLLQGKIRDPRLGFVGSISEVRSHILILDMERRSLPVVTPIAAMEGNQGQALNINGDIAAGAIAASLGANLILVTDVCGVMDRDGKLVKQMSKELYQQMLQEGDITAGMLPKLEAAFMATNSQAVVAICAASDLLSFFVSKPKGTMVF